MNPLYLFLITMLVGFVVFAVIIPEAGRAGRQEPRSYSFGRFTKRALRFFKSEFARNGELGGYVHDTNMAQYIPPNTFHCVTGTWTDIAGQVSGEIARHKAATAETSTINIPITIPSNAIAGKGSLLKYVEVDYEVRTDVLTSSTLSLVKVVRGADGAVAVVSAPAGTQLLTPATTAGTVNKHRDRFTLTTPAYIDDDEYYFLKMVTVATATALIDLYSAVAYFTERL